MNDTDALCRKILDAFPSPILYADRDHIIRYLNPAAEYLYYTVRGYRDLIGKSLLCCHNEKSGEKIRALLARFENHEGEICLGVNARNQRNYITPVRDENGCLIGYFERFEMNQQL